MLKLFKQDMKIHISLVLFTKSYTCPTSRDGTYDLFSVCVGGSVD